jgi:hypothetical protein
MFESGRRYYLQRGGGVAGVGGEEWTRVVALQVCSLAILRANADLCVQRVAHTFTSTNAPPLPLAQPLVLPSPLRSPGTHTLDSVAHKGFVLRPGDYVHIITGAEAEGEGLGFGRAGRPLIGRVVACWHDDAGEGGVSVQWYLRADEVHLPSSFHVYD